MGRRWCHEARDDPGAVVISTGVWASALGTATSAQGRTRAANPEASRSSAHQDTFPTLEMCPYPLPRILLTTPFVQGFPVRVGSPSAFNASHTVSAHHRHGLAERVVGIRA